jgi:hypothetical protein
MVEDVIELRPGAKPKKPRDPTNAERSRRFRANKKAEREARRAETATPTATAVAPVSVAPVTPPTVAQSVAQRPATPPTVAQSVAQRPATVITLIARYAAPVLLGMVGIALSLVGMIETAAYALASGGILSCALAILADALTLTMPTAIAALCQRRSPAVGLAAVLWLGGVAVTVSNVAGYVAEHVEDYQAGRETAGTERAITLERLARLRDERKAIAETRPPAAIVAAINNARRSEQPALREALATAKRRDALDAELATFEKRLADLPRVSTADASANVLSKITGAAISEDMLRKFRLACLLALPLCGGLVLAIGLALMPARAPA